MPQNITSTTISNWTPIPRFRWMDDLVPEAIEPLPPDDFNRYAAPTRNLRVGDRVRFNTVNRDDWRMGVILREVEPVEVHRIRNVPDWARSTRPHPCYSVEQVDSTGERRETYNSVAWFRIQRLETDE